MCPERWTRVEATRGFDRARAMSGLCPFRRSSIQPSGVWPVPTVVPPVPTTLEQEQSPVSISEGNLKTWSDRRTAAEGHPALQQVDRLLAGRPEELLVPVAGLPGRLAELFSVYEDLFELRDYRVMAVERPRDDLWIARIACRKQLSHSARNGSGNGSTGRR